jgi:hypothetical protein
MYVLIALALLFCPRSGRADVDAVPSEALGASVAADKAHPALLRLEQELSNELAEKKAERVTPEQHQAWKIEFLARLNAELARLPSSPDNTAVYARILAQLSDGEAAHAVLDKALKLNPNSPVLLTAKGQVLYAQNDFPGAAHNALQAWENSGRTDKSARALYEMSKGRRAPSGAASAAPTLSPLTHGPPEMSAEGAKKPINPAIEGGALPITTPFPGQPRKRQRLVVPESVLRHQSRIAITGTRILPVSIPPAGVLSYLPRVPIAVAHASAGFGDTISLGATRALRRYLPQLGMERTVDTEAVAYHVGEGIGVATSIARLGYAGTAKALPRIARGASELETCKSVVEGRNTLKLVFRAGAFPTYRMRTFEETLVHYADRPLSYIINKAATTDNRLNLFAGIVVLKTTTQKVLEKKKGARK